MRAKGFCESQSSFYGVFSRAYVGCPVYTLCMERLMLFNIYNITLKKKKKRIFLFLICCDKFSLMNFTFWQKGLHLNGSSLTNGESNYSIL
jgi:hypothetical protein